MFAVIFEVTPKPEEWDAYLHHAGLLRPELVKVDGFVENTRYRSTRHAGRILSLSLWRDEKALVRWRTHAGHNATQRRGRFEVFADYHLRVGQLTADTEPGAALPEQRLDETETGEAKAVSLVGPLPPGAAVGPPAGAAEWDLFDAILEPAHRLLLLGWRNAAEAAAYRPPPGARCRSVRVIRDYGLADRREAPQYFEPAGSLAGPQPRA